MLNERPVSKARMLKMLEKHQKGFVVDSFLTSSSRNGGNLPAKY